MVQRGQATYLIGTAPPYSDLRQYAVHRFRSVELLPSPAEGVSQFDLREYLASDALQFGSLQKIRLHAWASDSLARLLRETPLSPDMQMRRCEDGYQLDATVSDTWQLQWWILSQADNLIVEQPLELRQRLLEKLEGTLKRYQTPPPRHQPIETQQQ
ncbi:helix-turn-helix transcriptional regulator [Pseudomonas aeruginosa]